MKIKINKKLLLEDYMQDMINGVEDPPSVRNAESIDSSIENERLLDHIVKSDGKPGSYVKSKYDLFDSPDHTSLRMIKQLSKDAHIPYEQSVNNTHKYMKTIGHIENDNHVHGTNHVKGSTINGLYQTSDAQNQTDKNRFYKHFKLDGTADYLDRHKGLSTKDMNTQQQTAMTIAGLSKHGNSTNSLHHFSKMMDGDESAAKDMYFKDHHTNPDTKTRNRANSIFSNMHLQH